MHRIDHPLLSNSLGSHKTLTSFHFGPVGLGLKVYIQASLHAEELPGMLVAHHLRGLLAQAEAMGQLTGEVVLVPVANPLGLAQRVDHKPMGRFDLDTSENYNRHYPNLADAVFDKVRGALGPDAAANVGVVRSAMQSHLRAWQPATALHGMRKVLLGLACDADLVLDLHCDCEAVLHIYSEDACWPQIEPLARLLQAQAALLASNSGASSFDECLSGVWWQLAQKLAAALGPAAAALPLPQACASATVELRGESEVTHLLAASDAQAIFGFLQHAGVLGGEPPALPPARCTATPLAGSQTVKAKTAGIVVFHAEVGSVVAVGDPVAELVDPIAGTVGMVCAEVAGVVYARTYDRYALPGDDLANIAGSVAFRTGNLLGA